ncbi:MAG: DUF502 domain-containing protein [Halobaculum sp.]
MPLKKTVVNSLFAGVVLVTPLAITLFVLQILANWTLVVVDPVADGTQLTRYTANNELAARVLAAVLILLALTVLGYVAQRRVGQYLFGNVGRVVNVVPLVSTIYVTVRQVADSLVDRGTAYERVVLVEYPREKVYSLGLITGDGPEAVESSVGEEVYSVFLPNSPNPTAGRYVLLPESEVTELDMSVRRAMRLIVTTGVTGESAPATVLPDE